MMAAYPFDALVVLAVAPRQVCAPGCPEKQELDRNDAPAEWRSLGDPCGVVNVCLHSEFLMLEHRLFCT